MEQFLCVSLAIWITSFLYTNLVLTAKYSKRLFFINDAIVSPQFWRGRNKYKHTHKIHVVNSVYSNNENGHVINRQCELKEDDYEKVRKIILEQVKQVKTENREHVDSTNTLIDFLDKYINSVRINKSCSAHKVLDLFSQFVEGFKKYRTFSFSNLHHYDKDFYQWSLDFWSPLIDKEKSQFLGIENMKKIAKWKEEKHNIFLIGNHHIEADANIIRYFFKNFGYENLSKEIIFIGGHKIRVDPLSKPFTASANILCVYSKKYIENPIHLKEEKIAFNIKSLSILQNLLNEGNKIIWFTPSGGRDRKGSDGTIKISPFDPKIIQTFYVFAKKSKVKMHFVGLALNTYNLCQPPDTIDVDEIEKERTCTFTPIHVNLGEDIFDIYPNMKNEELCPNMYAYVNKLYEHIAEPRS